VRVLGNVHRVQRARSMTRLQLFIILIVMPVNSVLADCRQDRFGDVYCGKGKCVSDKQGKVHCSRYRFGDAVVDRHGSALCGKGRCLLGKELDRYVCSKIDGGGAVVDRYGVVKCYGGCERASITMCESDKGT